MVHGKSGERFSVKILILCFLLISLLTRQTVFADEDDPMDGHDEVTQSTLTNVQSVQKLLRQAGALGSICDDVKGGGPCTFAAECQTLQKNKDSIYLYKNSEGKTIPNYALYMVYQSVSACIHTDSPDFLNHDPFMNPTMFADATAAGGAANLQKNQQSLYQEIARATAIFKDTQARIVQVLESRKNGQNNAQLDQLENRVKTIQLIFPPVTADLSDLAAHGCEMPNAFYREESHQFWVCPQILNLPDASLQATMAHELGHSIDPCNSGQNLVKTATGYSVDFAKSSGPTFVPRLTKNQNPMASVVQCLQQKSSVGAQTPSLAELQKLYQDRIYGLNGLLKETFYESKRAVIQTAIDKEKGTLAAITKDYDRYSVCGELTKNGDVQESFADWVSSSVLAAKVHQMADPAKARQFTFESAGVFMSYDCPGAVAAQQSRVEAMMDQAGENCGMVFRDYDFLKDRSHPDSAKRVSRIYLAQPDLDKALSCQPSGVQRCQ